MPSGESNGDQASDVEFMLVNQSIPLVYRHTIQNVLNGLYGEPEYEFNEVLLLKKVAALFVTLATNKEPEEKEELFKVCQDWHDDQLVNVPRDEELKLLLDLAYKIVNTFRDRSDLIQISTIVNEIQAFIHKHHGGAGGKDPLNSSVKKQLSQQKSSLLIMDNSGVSRNMHNMHTKN